MQMMVNGETARKDESRQKSRTWDERAEKLTVLVEGTLLLVWELAPSRSGGDTAEGRPSHVSWRRWDAREPRSGLPPKFLGDRSRFGGVGGSGAAQPSPAPPPLLDWFRWCPARGPSNPPQHADYPSRPQAPVLHLRGQVHASTVPQAVRRCTLATASDRSQSVQCITLPQRNNPLADPFATLDVHRGD